MMSDPTLRRRWFQFSIRELILVILAVGIGAAWWIDHARLMEKIMEKSAEQEQ